MSDMYITPGIIKRLKKMFSRYIEDEDEASEDIPANKIIIRKNQLKKTKTAITAGDTLSSTNLEDVEDGLNLVNDRFAIITGNLASSADFSAIVNFPTGFTFTNTVLVSLSIYNSNDDNYRMGEGLITTGKRIFVHMDTNGIKVYNNDSTYYSSTFKVVIMKE